MLSSIKFYVLLVVFCVVIILGLITSQNMRAAKPEDLVMESIDTSVSNPVPDLELISRVISRPWGVNVDGDRLAVLSTSEFAMIDIHTPANPRIVDYIAMAGTASDNRHRGQVKEVLLQDNLAYAIWTCMLDWEATSCEGGGRLEIIDITDITKPQLIGSLETDKRLLNLTVLDSMVYLRLENEELGIVDISNPTTPQLRSITPLSNSSFSFDQPLVVYKKNNKVYLFTVKSNSSYDLGLTVLDVTDPDAPIQLSTYEPTDICIEDLDLLDSGSSQYLYLTDCYLGLRVMDVTDPANPVQVKTYDFGYSSSNGAERYSLVISGNHIYVPIVLADPIIPKELHILDISDPTTPVLANVHAAPYLVETTDIAATDSLLFLSDLGAGIQILDITNPVNPVELSEQAILEGYSHSDIAVDGQHLYIAGPDGMYIYDAFNPLDPQKIAQFDTPFHTSGVLVNNGNALVVDPTEGMIVLDVTDPHTPTQIGVTTGALPLAHSMVLSGTLGEEAYAYVGTEYGLKVVALSDLTAPTITQGSATNLALNNINLSEDTLYGVTKSGVTESELLIWDISEPLSPVILGREPLSVPHGQTMTVIDNYAYIASSWITHTLQIWDVKNPTIPTLLNTLDTESRYDDLTFDQEYLYASTRDDQLLIFGLTDPTAPNLLDEAALPVESVDAENFNEIAIQGDFVYVLHEGLSIWHHQDKAVGHTLDAWNRPFSNAVVTVNTNPMATAGLTGSFAPDETLSGTHELTATLSGYSSWPSVRTIDFDEPVTTDENFYMLGESVEEEVSPAAATTLIYSDTVGLTTELNLPVGAVSDPLTIQYQPTMAFDHENQSFIGNAFYLSPQPDANMLLDVTDYAFDTPVAVTIHYSDLGTEVVDESSLRLMVYKDDSWVDVVELCASDSDGYVRDEINNIVQVSVCQAGEFALFGDTEFIFLPMILR